MKDVRYKTPTFRGREATVVKQRRYNGREATVVKQRRYKTRKFCGREGR